MIIARVPASPAEKREAVGSNIHRKVSISTSSTGDSSLNQNNLGKERVKMARLLLKHGADVNIRDARGRTALMYASSNGLNELVNFLLNHSQAIFQLQDHKGENSVMLALPYPVVIQTYLNYMNDTDYRPSESFWRQRNEKGKSIFDLAKDISGTSKQSLLMLTKFITNSSSFLSYKIPAKVEPSSDKLNDSKTIKTNTGSELNNYDEYESKSVTFSPNEKEDIISNNCDFEFVEETIKCSKSLKQFWEKEAINWFNASSVIESNYLLSPRTSVDSSCSLSGASDAVDLSIKLPQIVSPLEKHENKHKQQNFE